MTRAKNHTRDYLKAISQAFFFDNAWFGLGLLLILFAFNRYFFYCAFSASVIGYLCSILYSTPKVIKSFGLIPINCFFFGLAMASLFKPSQPFYVSLVIGALVLPFITKAVFEVLQHWKLSPFIVPYILMVWVMWLCGRSVSLELQAQAWTGQLSLSTLPSLHPHWSLTLRMIWSIFESMGRLLFLQSAGFGLAALALVSAFSLRRGFFFFMGTLVATLAAYLLSAGTSTWEYGYFSYSAGLVGLGLAAFPEKFKWQKILLFCLFSTFLTMAVDQFLRGVQLPTLSLPYVFTLWLAILSRVPRLIVSWGHAPSLATRAVLGSQLSLDRLEEPERAA